MSNVIYGVGDIHGMSHHLRSLLDKIYADFRENGYEYGEIVFTGDYVDRGPDSKGVLDILMAGSEVENLYFITLLGNHDDALFTAGELWEYQYAQATLKSFGVERAHDIEPKYKAFIDRLWLKYESGPFFFCHAGIDPNRALNDQIRDDLLWIRGEFLRDERQHEKIIVHGHTPVTGEMEILHNRVNVDSHCYYSGVLSAMKWDGKEISAIQFSELPNDHPLSAFPWKKQ